MTKGLSAFLLVQFRWILTKQKVLKDITLSVQSPARLLKLSALNQELPPHSLRSLLAEAGVGLEQIMDRHGHSDDSTTRNVYLHITKEMKKEASQKFTQLMRSLQ
ncbi:hypothetical protein D5F11_002385 [Siminovitchia terrae]|uniref:Tyr recombinase domain-containing protein n=1 Tax=Siminovitchia terrae TaxID=1914933 RepID=A0A429XE87_SIMTE|nr:hypothetical protein D5F11_002385 [Siminovitchia terrae]